MTTKPTDGFGHIIYTVFPQLSSACCEYRKRHSVFLQGDAVGTVHYLASGMVGLERLDEDGRMSIVRVLKPGTLFGWSDLLGGGIHRNSAVALQTSRIAAITADRFVTALQTEDRLAAALFRQAAAQVDEAEDHILRLSTLGVPDRLYSALCSLAGPAAPAPDGTVEFRVPLMKRELAALIGTSPEGVSRGIRRLEELDVARFRGARVKLRTDGKKSSA